MRAKSSAGAWTSAAELHDEPGEYFRGGDVERVPDARIEHDGAGWHLLLGLDDLLDPTADAERSGLGQPGQYVSSFGASGVGAITPTRTVGAARS